MKLSKNFSLIELTKSQTAERKGIPNDPSADHISNLGLLCERVLQPVRDHFNHIVSISSGYRSPELCIAIGSSLESQHAKGMAADFEIFGTPNNEIANWISNNLIYDQLILEFWNQDEPNSGWVHCSYKSEGNRKQYLKAYKDEDNKTQYKPMLGDA
mgnify:CR=1 FL=1